MSIAYKDTVVKKNHPCFMFVCIPFAARIPEIALIGRSDILRNIFVEAWVSNSFFGIARDKPCP